MKTFLTIFLVSCASSFPRNNKNNNNKKDIDEFDILRQMWSQIEGAKILFPITVEDMPICIIYFCTLKFVRYLLLQTYFKHFLTQPFQLISITNLIVIACIKNCKAGQCLEVLCKNLQRKNYLKKLMEKLEEKQEHHPSITSFSLLVYVSLY